MPTMLLLNSGDMPTTTFKRRKLRTCRQCTESWFSQKGKNPQRCPNCNSRAWDRPKKKAGRPKDAKPKRKERGHARLKGSGSTMNLLRYKGEVRNGKTAKN